MRYYIYVTPLCPEDGGSKDVRKVGNTAQDYINTAASPSNRIYISTELLWIILQINSDCSVKIAPL
jgi:hypothetical protein